MKRIQISTGTKWEPAIGYSRAVRLGDHIYVTGTTSTLPDGSHVGDDDAYAQAKQALKNIEAALREAGATMRDVVRTRMYFTNIERDWQEVGRAHAETFVEARPATTLVEVSKFIDGWMLVEIEADAFVGGTEIEVRTIGPR